MAPMGYLLALILSCLIVAVLTYRVAVDGDRRHQTPDAYSQGAQADARRSCSGLIGADAFDCIYRIVESSQEQARSEQDLTAQQISAISALIVAIFTILTLGVTAVGVYFVRETLKETREAVKETAKATEAMASSNKLMANSQRPWLFAIFRIDRVIVVEEVLVIKYTISVRNGGSAPAEKVALHGSVFSYQTSPEEHIGIAQRKRDAKAKKTEHTSPPGEVDWVKGNYCQYLPAARTRIVDGHDRLTIMAFVAITYIDSTSGKLCVTEAAFDIEHDDATAKIILPGIPTPPPTNLTAADIIVSPNLIWAHAT